MTIPNTTSPSLSSQLEEQARRSEQKRVLRRISAALMRYYVIPPHEDSLIYLLADGNGESNREAIEYWVQQYADGNLNHNNNRYLEIRGALGQALTEMTEEDCY
jgi:hypothetical protein